jgi:hypothetical protein
MAKRSADCHDDRYRVLERFLREDLAGPDVLLQQRHHRFAAAVGDVVAARVGSGHRRAPRQGHAQRLADRGHRVGGEHAGARALGGARIALDALQVLSCDRSRCFRAHGLEHADDVQRFTRERILAGHDRAAVDEDRREVEPGARHEHPRK